MRNKFLKGLSVAFAAAIAFTVIAPATVSEAASSKVYVVSQKTENTANGTEKTKYTYDKRGRVTKEVTTYKTGTSKNYRADANGTYTEKVTNVQNIVNGAVDSVEVTDKRVDGYDTVTLATVNNTTITTEKTYYNSGALKDKVKTETKTTVTERANSVANNNHDDLNGSYSTRTVVVTEVAHTYDSKGNETGKVETETAYTPVYTSVSGINYEGTVSPGAKFTDIASVGNRSDVPYFNNKNYADDKTVTTTYYLYTNNANGMPTKVEGARTIETYDYRYGTQTAANSGVWVGDANSSLDQLSVRTTKVTGILKTFEYDKNGLPAKQVYTNAWKTETSTKVTAYNSDGSVLDAQTSAATTLDGADSNVTVTYKHDKSMNLVEKKISGSFNLWLSSANAFEWMGTYGSVADAAAQTNAKSTSTTDLTGMYRINSYESTTTYDNVVKEGSVAKTAIYATTTAIANGVTDEAENFDTTKYTLKKISVPSSRVLGVTQDTVIAQGDYDSTELRFAAPAIADSAWL